MEVGGTKKNLAGERLDLIYQHKSYLYDYCADG